MYETVIKKNFNALVRHDPGGIFCCRICPHYICFYCIFTFSTVVTLIRGSMKVDDKNIAKISVACDSDAFDTDKIEAKCELQQLDGSWKTIKTWREENDSSCLLYHKEWAIAKNYSYRLKVTAYTYKNSLLLESATEYFDYGYYH